eukprot:1898402-Karenia_brevis.AAC.1
MSGHADHPHSPQSEREELTSQSMTLSKATQTPRWQLSSYQAGLVRAFCNKSLEMHLVMMTIAALLCHDT